MGRFQSSEADSNREIYRSKEETKGYVDSFEATFAALDPCIKLQ